VQLAHPLDDGLAGFLVGRHAERGVLAGKLLQRDAELFLVLLGGSAYFTLRGVARELAVARLQTHFVAAVSHEFRTPLTSIQGYSELLTGSTTALEEVAELARVIHRESVQLAGMLDGMLLLDRLRSGALAVLPEPTDVNTAAAEAVARFNLARPDRAVELDLMPALPFAQADRGRLLQALGYLLANAEDRSPLGSPIVVRTRRERGSVCVAVVDGGLPIGLAEPTEAYDRFELAELERVRGGGAGLELALVREIAHLHGGRAWVECDEGGGCAFHLRLPSVRRTR